MKPLLFLLSFLSAIFVISYLDFQKWRKEKTICDSHNAVLVAHAGSNWCVVPSNLIVLRQKESK